MSRQFKLTKTSLDKINKWITQSEITDQDFIDNFNDIIFKDVKNIKDCSEKSIVDFYIESAQQLIFQSEAFYDINSKEFYDKLKDVTRHKLVDKYVSDKSFDNNIDAYFNAVKREYILHPQNESEELEFIPENRDIFIKNNLKLVIDCAKRYQNLGLPFEDLIQIGNMGLMIAFDKFDSERANLRFSIIHDIENSEQNQFTFDEAVKIIKKNFTYTKLLDSTLNKIPKTGFTSKKEFLDWTTINIKKASFSSISFVWIRAIIIVELNKYSTIVKSPKSSDKDKDQYPLSIIRLDSINPQTDDNYMDGSLSELSNEEFAIIDESMEDVERNNTFKELIEKLLMKLQPMDRRILKKRFGIDVPFPLSISEIANNEGISQNKVKYSISSSLKIIQHNIGERDKKVIQELLR